MEFWNPGIEIQFFQEALKSFATPEQLFYKVDNQYFAYIPKTYKAQGQTLQSRNSLIGQFTEHWCQRFFGPVAKELGLYAVNSVVCEEIGLSKKSSADLAFCTTEDTLQNPENIKLIFEIKMSIVSNYTFSHPSTVTLLGDYKSHKGNPSLLRSDSMLKAIGKAVNIRVSGEAGAGIPILVIGNSPITENYVKKVDFLNSAGVIQGFWSLNPLPADFQGVQSTPKNGFRTMTSEESLLQECRTLVHERFHYFSSMLPKKQLGKIIRIAAKENNEIAVAEKFLSLIHN